MNTECVICISRIKKGENGYAITCGHIFHGSCISTWMMTNNTCPFCRMKLASYKLIKLNCEVIGVAEDREETLKINNELFTSLSALTKESRNKNAQFIKFEKSLREATFKMTMSSKTNKRLINMKEELRLHYDRKDHMHKYVESNNRVLTEKDELIKRLIEKVGNLSVKFQYLKDDGIASEYVDDDDNFDNSDDDGDDEPLVLAGDTMKQFNNVQDYVKSQYKACKSYPELQMDFY